MLTNASPCHPAKTHTHLIGVPKLTVGVSVNGCLSLCVSPDRLVTCQASYLLDSWDTLQPSCDPVQDKQVQKIDGWMGNNAPFF